MQAALTRGVAARASRPTLWQTALAVLIGWLFAFAATLVAVLLLVWIDLPIQPSDGMTGRGWPWRVEGPWSLAADIGPLVLAGTAFAFGFASFIAQYTGIRCRIAPIALVAAAVGSIAVGNVSNAGLLFPNGIVAFVVIVLVARELSIRERRHMRWTWPMAAAAAGAAIALAAASFSYGFLHPLTAGNAELAELPNGGTTLIAYLHNEGRAEVELIGVALPGIELTGTRTETEPLQPGARIAGNGSRSLELDLPAACPSMASIDRINVALRVRGRRLDQVVRLAPPVPLACPR